MATANTEKPQGYEHADLVDEKQKHHVGNQMLGDVEQTLVNDPEYRAKEKKLVRKLDMTLMPMVWVLYMFNYLDRNNIASVLRHIDALSEMANRKAQASETQHLRRGPRSGWQSVQCCRVDFERWVRD